MMLALSLLESVEEKTAAQDKLDNYLQADWKQRELRRVVWRPDSREMEIGHNGTFWFVAVSPGRNQNTPRYWNSVGAYRDRGNLQIAVEFNIPIASNERTVAGFFAKDEHTGTTYLMHDGGIGGGRKGVGKAAFLAWSGEKPVPVADSLGSIRLGIVVTPIKPRVVGDHIGRFARRVLDFKHAVRNQQVVDDATHADNQRSYDDYYREFSGAKRGQRAKEIEYISRHGDIVDALQGWRGKRAQPGERIVKNAYIDLGITVADKLTELYEVKTNANRQVLYTAIGQILVHDAVGTGTQRYLVIPGDEAIPDDVERTLMRLRIRVIHFEMTKTAVRIRAHAAS